MIKSDGTPTIAWAAEPCPATQLLVELRDWFRNEVDAGDEALVYWVDRIERLPIPC